MAGVRAARLLRSSDTPSAADDVCVCVLCVCARARARDPTRPRARMRGVSPMMLCAGAHIALEQQDWSRWHEPMP